jgi:hypothetical protein
MADSKTIILVMGAKLLPISLVHPLIEMLVFWTKWCIRWAHSCPHREVVPDAGADDRNRLDAAWPQAGVRPSGWACACTPKGARALVYRCLARARHNSQANHTAK